MTNFSVVCGRGVNMCGSVITTVCISKLCPCFFQCTCIILIYLIFRFTRKSKIDNLYVCVCVFVLSCMRNYFFPANYSKVSLAEDHSTLEVIKLPNCSCLENVAPIAAKR